MNHASLTHTILTMLPAIDITSECLERQSNNNSMEESLNRPVQVLLNQVSIYVIVILERGPDDKQLMMTN